MLDPDFPVVKINNSLKASFFSKNLKSTTHQSLNEVCYCATKKESAENEVIVIENSCHGGMTKTTQVAKHTPSPGSNCCTKAKGNILERLERENCDTSFQKYFNDK